MIWVGDDWAEDHHDVEIQGEDGRRLARARLRRHLTDHPRVRQPPGRTGPLRPQPAPR
jgi:hypothetical protein